MNSFQDRSQSRPWNSAGSFLMPSLFAICFAFLALPADSQVTPVSDQFQVNTYTTDDQLWANVGIAPDGSFVVAWQSSEFTDQPSGGMVFQRFDSAGNPLGDETPISAAEGSSRRPGLEVSEDGSFVISWRNSPSNAPNAQFFDSSGNALGAAFEISTDDASDLTMDRGEGGELVVAWTAYPSFRSHSLLGSSGVVNARRYASDGTALGAVFEVVEDSILVEGPEIAVAPDGGFLVVWTGGESIGDDTSQTSIQARLYDSSGLEVGAQFQVNTFTTGFQRSASVDVDSSGRFVVVWTTDDGNEVILGQRYESSGSPIGGEFVIFDDVNDQDLAQVRFAPDDAFVVVWEGDGLQALRFDSTGSAVGQPLQFNEIDPITSPLPEMAVGNSGEVVVTWRSQGSVGNDDQNDSVQARQLLVPCETGACSTPLFEDDFESGDTSAWSTSQP